MLSLTKKSEYALVAVCHLAHAGNNVVVSAREIAEEHGMPLPLLMNVLKKLSQAGTVKSVRGARGGYSLAVPPRRLTLPAVIGAVEGPVRLTKCAPGSDDRQRTCSRAGFCSISKPVQKVHLQFLKFLGGVTVADLAYDRAYREAGESPKASKVALR